MAKRQRLPGGRTFLSGWYEPRECRAPFGLADNARLGGMNGELLDNRVCEQLRRELGHPLGRNRLGELDLESLALADAGDLAEAEAPAGTSDRLTLGVVNLGLQHHVDDESGHIPNSTRAGSLRAGRDPGRLAVAFEWSP
jgi:hypothetical protein